MSSDNRSAKKIYIIRSIEFVIIGIICLVSDLCSKAYASYYNAEVSVEMIPWIKNVLYFNYLKNYGAAFSILTGKTWILLIVTGLILIAAIFALVRMPISPRFTPLFFVLNFMIFGAIGNLIDRVAFGYVRDFIYFSPINFPVFNVADIYVTVSVTILVLLILFYYKDEELKEFSERITFWKKKTTN